MADSPQDLRRKVAIACRILGMLGLVRESTGHVSARIAGTDEMWIRCRGGNERGLMFTGLHNIRRADFDGKGPGLGAEHFAPHETPLHGEIYRARPDVQAIVHAHPYYALMCGIADLEFRPLFGGYEPSALDIVLKGVPVFPRSITVHSKELAAEMLTCLGDRDVLLMRGHGITVTGSSVEGVLQQAIRFDRLAHIMWEAAQSGRKVSPIPDEDLTHYSERRSERRESSRDGRPDWSGAEGAENWGWNHYVALLENYVGLPDDQDPAD